MKNDNLFNAIGNIDDELIYNAINDTPRKKNHIWIKWTAAAACLCAFAVGVAYLSNGKAGVNLVDTGSSSSRQSAGAGSPTTGGQPTAGGDTGSYSVAVFPPTESLDNVKTADIASLTESEALGHPLAKYLPTDLAEAYHFGKGSLYTTVMNDGKEYNLLRIVYVTGVVPEEIQTFDGGFICNNPDTIGDVCTISIMNYKPDNNRAVPSSDNPEVYILTEGIVSEPVKQTPDVSQDTPVAVFPPTESLDNVKTANNTKITKQQVLDHTLGKYIPKGIPSPTACCIIP